MRAHTQRHHGDVWTKFVESKAKAADEKKKQQAQITTFTTLTSQDDISCSLMKKIVVHDLPFQYVEWEETKKTVSKNEQTVQIAQPKTSGGCKSTLVHSVHPCVQEWLPNVYMNARKEIIKSVRACDGISLSMDCWTTPYFTDDMLSLTCKKLCLSLFSHQLLL